MNGWHKIKKKIKKGCRTSIQIKFFLNCSGYYVILNHNQKRKSISVVHFKGPICIEVFPAAREKLNPPQVQGLDYYFLDPKSHRVWWWCTLRHVINFDFNGIGNWNAINFSKKGKFRIERIFNILGLTKPMLFSFIELEACR